MRQRSRASLVLAIFPNFHSMWEFVKNLVLNKLQIFTESKKRQKLRILMEQRSMILNITYAKKHFICFVLNCTQKNKNILYLIT